MSDPAAAQPAPVGSWRFRRRIIHCTLIYVAVLVPVLTWRFPDSTLVSQTIVTLLGLAGTVICTYILGAAWDDKNARKVQP